MSSILQSMRNILLQKDELKICPDDYIALAQPYYNVSFVINLVLIVKGPLCYFLGIFMLSLYLGNGWCGPRYDQVFFLVI